MFEKAFKLTSKDLIKLSVMLIMATLLFGLPGLVMMLILQWATQQSYAIEPPDKHGISQISASRLGGVLIFVLSLILYILATYTGLVSSSKLSDIPIISLLAVIVCMVIGLVEDLSNNLLSPRARLLSTMLIFGLCLGLWPALIPLNLGVLGLDYLLSVRIVGWFVTLVFCIGFINAINMADGANGLMPGTLTIAFVIFYLETESPVYAVLMTTCGLFTIFNVISGRLFLGDSGSYGLGAVLVLSGLYLFSEKIFSVTFLAILFSYPCIDLLVTVVRRLFNKSSILLPDNDHLHNRIHFHCNRWFRSRLVANSMTGILIVSCSSGIAWLGYNQEWWPITSNEWVWIFLAQFTLYCLAFIFSEFHLESSLKSTRNKI